MVSNTRLYGAAIAAASGSYSVWSAAMMSGSMASRWLMGVLGVVVLVHGAVLLTGSAERLGRASGHLMSGYAVVMLLIQALLAAGVLGGMNGGMSDGMGGSAMTAGMGWDAGMVFLALLMLVSGVIMTRGDSMGTTEYRM